MKGLRWFITYCGGGRTVFAQEVTFIGETKTQLKFKTKNGKIVKARKREAFLGIKNCHEMLDCGSNFKTIKLLDIETTKQENYITSYL